VSIRRKFVFNPNFFFYAHNPWEAYKQLVVMAFRIYAQHWPLVIPTIPIPKLYLCNPNFACYFVFLADFSHRVKTVSFLIFFVSSSTFFVFSSISNEIHMLFCINCNIFCTYNFVFFNFFFNLFAIKNKSNFGKFQIM